MQGGNGGHAQPPALRDGRRKLIRAGFHVICEKPVTTTAAEATQLAELLSGHASLIFAVAYTYTGYPMVRQMRDMLREGAIGAIHKVDVQYYQGWINAVIHERAKRAAVWRLDPPQRDPAVASGDIGIHAFNLHRVHHGHPGATVLGGYRYPVSRTTASMSMRPCCCAWNGREGCPVCQPDCHG